LEDSFRIFALPHIAYVLSLPAVAGALAWWSGSDERRIKTIRYTLGVILLVNELAWYWYYVRQDWFVFPFTLPLQLCDILVWIAVIAALTARRWSYEILYYWALSGTTMALLTPDVSSSTFSYLTIRFFVSHGGIIVVLLFLVWKKMLRPRPGSWRRALLYLHCYAAAAGLFNYVFGTNFFYLCEKPSEATLLDFLGPWPWYILAGDAIALVLFWLLWLPFRNRKDIPVSKTPQADES